MHKKSTSAQFFLTLQASISIHSFNKMFKNACCPSCFTDGNLYMPSEITTDIRVTLILKEFVLATNGSDKLYLKSQSCLANNVIDLLQKQPTEFRPLRNRAYYLRLVLPFNEKKDVRTYNYLDERGQYIISQKLNKNFKMCFHNFMLGSVRSGKRQSDSILDFCATYLLKLDDINYDMLKKSWDRSNEKKIWQKALICCPLNY